MKRVVIVGIGFAGLRAARRLAGSGMNVVLVDRENFHLFQPLLYQVATAALEQESIAYPVRAMLRRWKNVGFRLAEACGVDADGKRLLTSRGDIPYDYLILAGGSVTNFFGMEDVRKNACDLKRLDQAADLRSRILACFENACAETDPERRRALMTFVIVGGGPTGVEFAGALAELVRFVLAHDYPELSMEDCRIVLVEFADYLLRPFPEKLRLYARQRLERLGVTVITGRRVVGASPEAVRLDDGVSIPTNTLFWSSGVRAAPLADAVQAARGPQERLRVEPDLTLPGHPEILVAGDMAYLEQDGEALPMIAPVAMQQGDYAARAVLAREGKKSLPPFRYRDRGTMATVGKGAAVARLPSGTFTGFAAWILWLGLHLFYLIGFRNRLLVLMNWSWYYFFYERQIRIITREGEAGKCPLQGE